MECVTLPVSTMFLTGAHALVIMWPLSGHYHACPAADRLLPDAIEGLLQSVCHALCLDWLLPVCYAWPAALLNISYKFLIN